MCICSQYKISSLVFFGNSLQVVSVGRLRPTKPQAFTFLSHTENCHIWAKEYLFESLYLVGGMVLGLLLIELGPNGLVGCLNRWSWLLGLGSMYQRDIELVYPPNISQWIGSSNAWTGSVLSHAEESFCCLVFTCVSIRECV